MARKDGLVAAGMERRGTVFGARLCIQHSAFLLLVARLNHPYLCNRSFDRWYTAR